MKSTHPVPVIRLFGNERVPLRVTASKVKMMYPTSGTPIYTSSLFIDAFATVVDRDSYTVSKLGLVTSDEDLFYPLATSVVRLVGGVLPDQRHLLAECDSILVLVKASGEARVWINNL
jgi:hypothetical protein